MGKRADWDEQIDAYLLGQMSATDRSRFENEMAENMQLQEAVAEREQLVKIVVADGDQRLKQKLRTHAEGRRAYSWKRSAGWALLAALALAIVTLFYFRSKTTSTDLFAEYYQPYSIDLSDRQAGELPALQSARQAYANGNYAAALPIFEQHIASDTAGFDIVLAAGIAALEVEQTERAIGHFERLLASGPTLFTDHARWYLALVHLRDGNLNAVRNTLAPTLEDVGADHHSEAQMLLQSLPDE